VPIKHGVNGNSVKLYDRAYTVVGNVLPGGGDDQREAVRISIYGWFTKGFDTRDLLEAKALPEELRQRATTELI